MIEKIKSLISKNNTFTQFIKFGIVGASNTIISYVVYVIVLLALKDKHYSWDYLAGNVISFVISVAWSFYWNNKLVFTKKEGEVRVWWKALLKTYASYAFSGLILSNILSWIWIDVLGISSYIAPLINLVVTIPINFLMNKFWAFRIDK